MLKRATQMYAPTSLSDLVFANDVTQKYFDDLVQNKQVVDLILHGPPGTGKSTLARLLPSLRDPKVGAGSIHWIDCHQHRFLESIETKVRKPIMTWPFGGDYHHVILEEADMLRPDAMAALKPLIEKHYGSSIFTLTTNNLDKIDAGVRSRCTEKHIARASTDRWLPRIRSIITAETGKVVPDDALREVISLGGGDGRKIVYNAQQLILRIKARTTSQPVSKGRKRKRRP